MRHTPKRAQTNSLTARIVNVATAVLAGPAVRRSRQRELQLAKAALSLHRENLLLTSKCERLQQQLAEVQRLRSEAIRQLNRAQVQSFKRAGSAPLVDLLAARDQSVKRRIRYRFTGL